ncbi:hydroperoxide isomerase ALOXE3-like [Hoplias malabaricus]|uniref:hydroperoxide isomerase ALOXE3-like n=1 Tax=Hoplias malabaricus TaxID=27720 RepID=UPI0034621A76
MVEYTVEVHGNAVLTLEGIHITLIGSICDSGPQLLHTLSPSAVHRSRVSCAESMGKLLLLKLEARPGTFGLLLKEWFCSKVVVVTHEGQKVQFPCYQWLNHKKTAVCLRDDKAVLINKENNPTLLRQRQQELETRRHDFRWKEFPGLPWGVDANAATDVPNEVRFSFTKAIEMQLNRNEVLLQMEIERLTALSDSWSSFEEIHSCLRCPEVNDYVLEHWESDAFFGDQFLNGLNPMMIKRCSELPQNFPVTDEMVKQFLGGSCLKEELQNGNLFLCDYQNLSGFAGNVINKRRQSLAAPLCLLYSTPEKQLKPIAIQLFQEPGEENPIFLPSDSEHDWLLAKIFVRSAEFHEHELNFHLLRTHFLAEVFTVSTLRNLPSAHPLFKLLMPHTRYTLQINIMARNILISPDGIFKKFTAIGALDAVEKFLPRATSSLTYSSLCLPDNIKERGLEDIPNYYYRDDGLQLWNTIHEFVGGVLKYYYKNDEDVEKDTELQKWISEIFQYGFLKNKESGIPESFSSDEEVVKFITMVIFTVSGQHAAVNNGQFEFGGWMPNLPTSLRLPPPKTKGQSTKTTIFQTLPSVSTTIHGLAVLKLLSTKSSDHYPLGVYKEELFGDAGPLHLISEFKKSLGKVDEEITARNKDLELPYVFLQPVNVDNSVAL